MVQHGRRERWPARQAGFLVPAATGDALRARTDVLDHVPHSFAADQHRLQVRAADPEVANGLA